MEEQNATIVELTADIVSSYLTNNKLDIAALPDLIRLVNSTLARLGQEQTSAEPEEAKATPAQIKKSIRPDGLVSFIDGKPYRTLKRHLSKHGFTPQDYKARFGLPDSYPMTAPDYSAKRSEMAKSLGLGRQTKAVAAVEAPAPKPKAQRKTAAKKS